MPHSKYIVWDTSPTLFKTGVINLPFAFSLAGIILSIILYYYIYNYLIKQKQKNRQGEVQKNKNITLPAIWTWSLIIGTLVVGQLVTIPFNIWLIHSLGPFTVRYYGVIFAIAFLLGYYLGVKMFKDAGKPQERLDVLFIYVIIATVIGARLGQVFFYTPDYYFSHPAEIIKIWHGGLASHGAAIGILIGIWLYVRKYPDMKYIWVLDRVVIPVVIGGAFVRIGNFFNSEIIGRVTHVPWAIIFERVDMLPRHPSMLYESFCYFIGFFILWRIYKHYKAAPPDGLLLGVFLVYVFVCRFLIEFTKTRQADFTANWPISMGQLLSIPFIIFGIWLLVKYVKYPSKNNKHIEEGSE